jgi:predicted nuclease of predicted toxin-antitoxin system
VRFLVDECTGPAVANWLRSQSHEVFSVYDEAPGIDDDAVLGKADAEKWILITNDKEFGGKIFREKRTHHGVILLRLADERPRSKVATIEKLMRTHADQLADRFVVVTETRVRFAAN